MRWNTPRPPLRRLRKTFAWLPRFVRHANKKVWLESIWVWEERIGNLEGEYYFTPIAYFLTKPDHIEDVTLG